MHVERPLSQKEKALLLNKHVSTISAMTRAGLPRMATASETVEWVKNNQDFRFRAVYAKRRVISFERI